VEDRLASRLVATDGARLPQLREARAARPQLRDEPTLELHHVDLDAGYRTADWSPAFVALDLPEPMRSQRADRLAW